MRILCFLFCFVFILNGAAPTFEYTYEFTLKKDERASVEISELGYEDKKQNFDFYWTLFDNTNLIVHTKYRKFPRQFVLSLRRNLNWASQTLIPDFKNPQVDKARLILEFSDFVNGEAKLSIYIEDKDSRLFVNFIDPRKNGALDAGQ